MADVVEQLEGLRDAVDGAVSAAKSDGGASPVLVAVVEEFGRKFGKALGSIREGGDVREAVVEAEQAADSAKYAAEADGGLAGPTRQTIVDAHNEICVLKNSM